MRHVVPGSLVVMPPEERAALVACRRALGRIWPGAFFAPRPFGKSVRFHRALIHDLVRRGLLRWGNRCRSFVVLTEAGRLIAAIEEAPR